MLAAGFDHLLNAVGPVAVVADELLDLVEDDEGEWESVVIRERVLDAADHVVVGDVLDLGKLGDDAVADAHHIQRQSRLGLQQGRVQIVGYEEIGKLPFQAAAFLRQGLLYSFKHLFPLQPHDEAGLVVFLRQAGGLEDDAEQGEADVVPGAGAELSGCGVQTAIAFSLGVQLAEVIVDFGWEPGDAARRGAVVETHIDP